MKSVKGGWDVAPKYTGDFTMFQVYRLLDVTKPDSEDNREYQDKLYHNKDEALKAAKLLNIKESERFWRGCSR